MSIEDFYTQAQKYVAFFDAFAQKHALADRALADHICYKCDSTQEFERMRALLEHESAYVYQSIISKRRISYIKFKRGIETTLGTILFLELSDQKLDGSQKSGFDHIEAYPTQESYEEFVREFEKSEKVVKVERPHHTTHDIDIGEGFLFRCTRGSLLEKIKAEEML